jgi:hypothetical protein
VRKDVQLCWLLRQSFFKQLIIIQPVKNFPPFIKRVDSSLCSQKLIQSQFNPVNIFAFYFFKSLFYFILPSIHLYFQWFVPLSFQTEIVFAFLVSPLYATCLVSLNGLITLSILGDE